MYELVCNFDSLTTVYIGAFASSRQRRFLLCYVSFSEHNTFPLQENKACQGDWDLDWSDV